MALSAYIERARHEAYLVIDKVDNEILESTMQGKFSQEHKSKKTKYRKKLLNVERRLANLQNYLEAGI